MKEFKNLGFDSEESERVVENLNSLLANLHVHYQKLRNYHWNVTGGEFFDIHETTEAEYTEVVGEIDEIAERIRVFGATPISTLKEYLEVSEIEETGTDLSSKEIIEEILRDYEILFSFMVETIETAREIGDISTDDLVTGFMRRREKMHWMLSSFNKED
ncbi:Dps family protein [Brumimicrobium aurantiacum]|uniref:DNA starvation/stationary phase protection protein n=1 Tax=Brumimicrobium aurantiacum TaxID=1737063 RepID=A0A3E1EZG1_9FLAO|nr:DNA starvation/stationary phase protection protein [Brumimicrobium aurantiacum]RFC54959.1 DNA starvation/stationary phase protection protein [Brumimicrobium aurantiacum]